MNAILLKNDDHSSKTTLFSFPLYIIFLFKCFGIEKKELLKVMTTQTHAWFTTLHQYYINFKGIIFGIVKMHGTQKTFQCHNVISETFFVASQLIIVPREFYVKSQRSQPHISYGYPNQIHIDSYLDFSLMQVLGCKLWNWPRVARPYDQRVSGIHSCIRVILSTYTGGGEAYWPRGVSKYI